MNRAMPDTISKPYSGVRDADNVISIKASLVGKVSLEKETGLYVSYCPALDLSSQGTTSQEAEKNIIEATKVFIEDCFERGVLREILKECGFHSIHQNRRQRTTRKGRAIDPGIRQISITAELPVMAMNIQMY